MKLNKLAWPNHKLASLGYSGFNYNLDQLKTTTANNPTWIHFGAGNIFRAFPAKMAQDLINQNKLETGIIIAEGYDEQIIDHAFDNTDNLTILVTLKADGSVEKTIIGSITEALRVNYQNQRDFERLETIFAQASLQMVSFTITEKGYQLKNNQNQYYPDVEADFKTGVLKPVSYLGKLVYLLYRRYLFGSFPIALVSMDNYAHNGDKLKESVLDIANHWLANQLVDKDFINYLTDPNKVSYPWSMIDKITPRPDLSVLKMLEADGFSSISPVVTNKNTYVSPFVNAEETGYLVIEDHFPNGRPPLELVGAIFTDRNTVDRVEKMKVGTCLNPLHTALAIFGCLLGYTKISDELKDPSLVKLIEQIGYVEGLKVVVDPKIIDPKEFIDTVINVRLPNPFMPDTPQRIATDTSQKLAIRFGGTINSYLESKNLDANNLTFIPLVYAGYLRYLLAIDDNGNSFELSSDPLLDKLRLDLGSVKFKDQVTITTLEKLLTNEQVFGLNLIKHGLANKIVDYFNMLNAGVGAVKDTLISLTSK